MQVSRQHVQVRVQVRVSGRRRGMCKACDRITAFTCMALSSLLVEALSSLLLSFLSRCW